MDIVERLRHGHTRYAAETHQEATIRRIKAMDEAADEIERLREALEIISCKCKSNCGKDEGNCLYWIARSALQKKG